MLIPSFVASLTTTKVTVDDLEAGRLKPVILIDVRSPEEYASDRIGQSLLVPLDDIQYGNGVQRVREIAQASLHPNQAELTFVLYCEICPGAIRAYQKLKQTGLNLAVLYGGITAWRQLIPPNKDSEILAEIYFPSSESPAA